MSSEATNGSATTRPGDAFFAPPAAKGAETRRALKIVGGSALWYGLGGLLAGALVGGAFGYQKFRRRSQFQELLTRNPCLDLSALYSDEPAVEAFAELMPYQTHHAVAWDSALYSGDRILRLAADLRDKIGDPKSVVEDIPHAIGEQLVQLQRALLAIREVVVEKHGYMVKQFNDAAADVMKRFSDVSFNASADVRDRKVRPI